MGTLPVAMARTRFPALRLLLLAAPSSSTGVAEEALQYVDLYFVLHAVHSV